MTGGGAKCSKVLDQGRRRDEGHFARQVGGAQKSIFGQRATRPLIGFVAEPVVRNIVMHMIRIEQREQHVYVEKRDCHQASSRSLSTISTVRTLPGSWGSSGTPLRTRMCRLGSSPFLASSDTTSPAVLPRARASSFAA